MVATRDEADIAHIRLDVGEKYTDGEGAVVGVGPELNVLVPADFFSAIRGFEVEFAVMVFDVRTE